MPKKTILEIRVDWVLAGSFENLFVKVLQGCSVTEPEKSLSQTRENPVIADRVQVSKGLSEGLLGGWLAQRQAALRGGLAAGARYDFTLVSRACRDVLEHALCQRKCFFGNLKLFGVRGKVLTTAGLDLRCCYYLLRLAIVLRVGFDQKEVAL